MGGGGGEGLRKRGLEGQKGSVGSRAHQSRLGASPPLHPHPPLLSFPSSSVPSRFSLSTIHLMTLHALLNLATIFFLLNLATIFSHLALQVFFLSVCFYLFVSSTTTVSSSSCLLLDELGRVIFVQFQRRSGLGVNGSSAASVYSQCGKHRVLPLGEFNTGVPSHRLLPPTPSLFTLDHGLLRRRRR